MVRFADGAAVADNRNGASLSLSEEAANILRRLILLERLPPGMPLTERELSDALGVSRTPLREAIKQLASEGLVEISASRRPRVADPSSAELADALRVQGALEALSGELACVVATNAEIQEIAERNAEMVARDATDDPLTAFERDMAFHRAIVAAGGNAALAETHSTYNARLWRARFMSSQRSSARAERNAEHDAIVAALSRRDAPAAAAALKLHLTTAVTNIEFALRNRAREAHAAS